MSALIFVALAVGWAAYLIPAAIRGHEVPAESLPLDADGARLLPRTSALTLEAMAVRAAAVRRPTPAVRRHARAAARRRALILALLLLVLGAVATYAALGRIPSLWVFVPGFVVACWLIVCRTAGRVAQARSEAARGGRSSSDEGARRDPVRKAATATEKERDPSRGWSSSEERQRRARRDPVTDAEPATGARTSSVEEARRGPVSEADAPALWDPVPMTLPTYVGKPVARRTVRTVDLTQVTSSGHDAIDSALARQAEADAARAAPATEEPAWPDVRREAAG